MLRALILFLMLATPAFADRPAAGLMWHRSGLPATFPMQVRTDAGPDWFLQLIDLNGKPVLAAYIHGGQFFKVLVPPGEYRVTLASGWLWQNETELFGDETQHYDLPDPLHFKITGAGRKTGQTLDLRGVAQGQVASVTPQSICDHIWPGLDQVGLWADDIGPDGSRKPQHPDRFGGVEDDLRAGRMVPPYPTSPLRVYRVPCD